MTAPYAAYTAEAGQRDFNVPFPFINRSHVFVQVNGDPQSILSWPSGTSIRLPFEQTAGSLVEIYRDTPLEGPLVEFQDGAVLTADDLNIAVRQVLYRQQEIDSDFDRSIRAAQDRLADEAGVPRDELFLSLAGLVAEQAAIAEFRQRLADLDTLAQQTLTNAQEIIEKQGNIDNLSSRADSLRTDLTTLTGVVDSLAGADPDSGLATLIQNEETARISGDQALVDTLALIGAKSADNLAFVANLATLKVSPTESLAERLDALSAADADNAASIATEQSARASAVAAEANRIDLLTARVDTAEADIISEQTARSDGDTALTASVDTLIARVDDAETAILTEQTARSNGDSAIASDLTLLTTRVGAAEAAIVAEQTARADGDAATASTISALVTQVDDVSAAIATEQQARVDGDAATASTISALDVRMGDAEATITQLQSGSAYDDSAIVASVDALTVRVDDAEALVASEQTARINGDAVLATSIDLVDAKTDQNNATIGTVQTAVAGLQARYGVQLDVNGYVTGFVQHNNGQSGSFVIRADHFAIVDPNQGTGQNPLVPFEVYNGTVYINGNVVLGGSISGDKLEGNAVTDGASSFTDGVLNIPSNTWTTAQSVTYAASGGEIRVDFSGAFSASKAVIGAPELVAYRIKRGSTIVRSGTFASVPGATRLNLVIDGNYEVNSYVDVPGNVGGSFHIFVVDSGASSGNHTYTVELLSPVGGSIRSRQMALLELKR